MSGRQKKYEGGRMRAEDGGRKAEAPRKAQGGDGGLPTAAVMARALVEGIDRLHMERCSLVLRAKGQKAAGERGAYAATWELVTEISLQIEQAEADLEEMGGRASLLEDVPACADGQTPLAPLLRDPKAELPDDDITVCVITDAEEFKVWNGYHDGEDGFIVGDAPAESAGLTVTGWCHLHEAAEALRKAVRHG